MLSNPFDIAACSGRERLEQGQQMQADRRMGAKIASRPAAAILGAGSYRMGPEPAVMRQGDIYGQSLPVSQGLRNLPADLDLRRLDSQPFTHRVGRFGSHER